MIIATACAHIALFVMFKVIELGKGDLIRDTLFCVWKHFWANY